MSGVNVNRIFGQYSIDIYILDLANLVKPGVGLEFERVPLPPELAYGVMPVCDREYEEPAAAEVLALAEQLGPLFGWGDADPMGNVAREPVAAWIAAAKVLNFAVRAHAYTGSLERMGDANMEGDVAYLEIDGWPARIIRMVVWFRVVRKGSGMPSRNPMQACCA